MENGTGSANSALEDDRRDIANIWNEALARYQSTSQVDLGKLPTSEIADFEALIKFGCDQIERFNHFRHKYDKSEKLRRLYKSSMRYIQAEAGHMAAATTPIFPPAAVIGTALNYLLNVSLG
jgi:hypothetical protein